MLLSEQEMDSEIAMKAFILIILFMSEQTFAKPPECPSYADKQSCLQSVENNYKDFLDFLDEDYKLDGHEEMIQAAKDIRHFESLACLKTCGNDILSMR